MNFVISCAPFIYLICPLGLGLSLLPLSTFNFFFIEIYITEAKMTVLVLDGSEEGVGIRRSELNRVRIIFFLSLLFK